MDSFLGQLTEQLRRAARLVHRGLAVLIAATAPTRRGVGCAAPPPVRVSTELPELGYDNETLQWAETVLNGDDPTPPFDRTDTTEFAADGARLRGVFPYLCELSQQLPAAVVESRLEGLLTWLDRDGRPSAVWDSTNVALRVLGFLHGIENLRRAGLNDLVDRLLPSRYLAAHRTALAFGSLGEPTGNHQGINVLGSAALSLLEHPGSALPAPAISRLTDRLSDQFLPDGGHVEHCPYYHVQLLSAIDRVAEVQRARSQAGAPVLTDLCGDARRALGDMMFGPIPARFGDISRLWSGRTHVREVEAVNGRTPADRTGSVLPDFGVASLRWCSMDGRPVDLVTDVGPLGLSVNPGHGHDDQLSYCLRLGDTVIVADPGVHRYSAAPADVWFKLASAHSTVRHEGAEHQPRGFYRWPRDARESTVTLETTGPTTIAAVRSWPPGSPIRAHRRQWQVTSQGLVVRDRIRSGTRGGGIVRVSFGPECRVTDDDGTLELRRDDGVIVCRVRSRTSVSSQVRVLKSRYSPRYGTVVPSDAVEWHFPATERDWSMHVHFLFQVE